MAVDSGVNNNALETLIAVRCEVVNHVPTLGGLGMFFIRGSKLLPSSNKTLTEKPEVFLGQEGCGYEGCHSSGTNSLQDQLHELSTMVPCSNRAYEHDVVLEEACQEHEEVCSGTLVLSLCKTLCKWLQGRFRRMFNDGCGLAHQTLLGLNVSDSTPSKEVFAIFVKSAVSWAICTLGNATPVADDNDEYNATATTVMGPLISCKRQWRLKRRLTSS